LVKLSEKTRDSGVAEHERALAQARAREAATREVLAAISSSRDDDGPVFDAVLRKATELCETTFASLWLVSEDRQRIYRAYNTRSFDEVATRRQGEAGNSHYRLMSDRESTLVRPLVEKRAFHVADLRELTRYSEGMSPNQKAVDTSGIRAVLSVPLMDGGEAIGTILLCRLEPRAFTEDQIQLVQTFAEQAVIAIENVRQFKALETLNTELEERVREQVDEIARMGRLKRFLPAAVANTVMASGADELLRSHRALLGVLFCDIRGFTAFCEIADPEETIEVLKTYHSEMGKLIAAHGAGVDHRMGDGIMVLFNDPLACDDPAGKAVRLGIAMRDKMEELGRHWKRLGHNLGFGVGISLGYATVGMVGYEDRSDYTASGSTINLASRLCDEARSGEILLSARARAAVQDDYPIESVGAISLKGMREAVEVFRLAGGPDR
jgi:class 3 adenylate cyclase